MTQTEYKQKKRECWDALYNELLKGEVQWQPVSRKDIFNLAFDRAYALGKQFGNSEQVDVEKAAEKFADEIRIPASIPGVMVPFINGLAHDAYLQGAQDCLGKQETKQETVIQGWVARDNGGFISLFSYRPDRVIHNDLGFWGHNDGSYEIDLPNNLFPDLTWESEPEPVEIIIKRKKK